MISECLVALAFDSTIQVWGILLAHMSHVILEEFKSILVCYLFVMVPPHIPPSPLAVAGSGKEIRAHILYCYCRVTMRLRSLVWREQHRKGTRGRG